MSAPKTQYCMSTYVPLRLSSFAKELYSNQITQLTVI